MSTRWIIFYRTGALGDFILSLPLLRELSRRPEPICVIARPAFRQLLPPDCRCEHFLDPDSTALLPLFSEPESSCSDTPFLRLCNGAEFYLFLKPDPALEQRLHQLGALRIFQLNPKPMAPPHAALQFLAGPGLPADPAMLDRPLFAPPTVPGEKLWLHPGSGSPAKNWPPPFFAAFAAAWQQKTGKSVAVSFGEADQDVIAPVTECLVQRQVKFELIQGLTIVELQQRLRSEAGLYLGNDSGVTHLAGASGIPTVALFRSTDPKIWRPFGNCRILTPDLTDTITDS